MQYILDTFTQNIRRTIPLLKSKFSISSSRTYHFECRNITYSKKNDVNCIYPKRRNRENDSHFSSNCKLRKRCILFAVSWAGLFQYLELDKVEKNTDMTEVINIIKKAEKAMQHNDYDKAERLFLSGITLALKLNYEGAVTYINSRRANLAFDTKQYHKARVLYLDIIKRLDEKGMEADDLPMIYISFKLAKIFEYNKQYEEANMGLEFCYNWLRERMKNEEDPEHEEIKQMYQMVLIGYAYYFYQTNNFADSILCFEKAYGISVEMDGETSEKSAQILNNMGTVYIRMNNIDDALKSFHKAEETGKQLTQWEHLPYVFLNIAHAYKQKNVLDKALQYCEDANKNATQINNEEVMKESTIFLEKIKGMMSQS